MKSLTESELKTIQKRGAVVKREKKPRQTKAQPKPAKQAVDAKATASRDETKKIAQIAQTAAQIATAAQKDAEHAMNSAIKAEQASREMAAELAGILGKSLKENSPPKTVRMTINRDVHGRIESVDVDRGGR